MNKGIIVTRANYPIGSWSNRVKMIAKGLLYNNISIEVLVTTPWPTQENINNSDNFVKFLTKPSQKNENFISILKQLITLFKLYKQLKKKEDIDFILLTGDRFLDAIILILVKKKSNIKLFVEVVDEIGRQFDNRPKNLYDKLAILNRKFFYLLLNKFDKIFVISTYLKFKLKQKVKDKSKIILSPPTFIDEETFNYNAANFNITKVLSFPSISDEGLIISYAGSCLRPNGLFFFLENLSDILKDKQYVVYVIFICHIGDLDIIRKFVKDKNLTKYVYLYQSVEPKFLPSFYKKSDILILPEQGDVIANAGFPGKTGEYLISGKPIITTNFSDLNLFFKNEENCMISEIGDSIAYKNNLIKIINDKALRNKIGEEAKKMGKKYFNYKNAVNVYLKYI